MKNYKKVYDFYIEKNEEYLIKYFIPENYIDGNIDKNNVSVEFAIRFLQNELNDLLNSFVNGGFSRKGFILYPFVKDLSKENKRKIKRLGKTAVFLNNNGYNFSNSIKKCQSYINSKNFPIILSALYQDFSQVKSENTKLVKKIECQELGIDNHRKSDLEYLKPLNGLKDYANKNLKQHLSGFYLHGSLATKDYIKGWSDVDTLSIVSKDTIENPAKLIKLRDKMYYIRKFFYKIDPLQHHGSIIINEYDLDSYCQTYFPVPIFKYAKSFFGDDKIINFRVRDFSREAIKKLFWFVNYFRRMHFEKKFNLGSYDTKILLHSITLFPTMYLQAKGTLVYKKFSFNIAKKDFKKGHWEVIDDASLIRSKWRGFGTIPLICSFSHINPLLFYQLNSRVTDFFKDVNKENNVDTKKIIKNIFKLSEKAWEKIKKNVKSKGL